MRLDELELDAAAAVGLANGDTPFRSAFADAKARCRLLAIYRFPLVLGIILTLGILLRLLLPAGFTGVGFDENLYRLYVQMLDHCGLTRYPVLIRAFIAHQLDPTHQAILPPTRLVYITGGYLYHRILGCEPLRALGLLSSHFSILTLLLSALVCWRMTRQRTLTLAVVALMACAPTEIHLAQHRLIDGVFGFWALLVMWLVWENLQSPTSLAWSIGLGSAFAMLVMTKENAFFVFAVVLGLLAANHWLRFGVVTRRLVYTTLIGSAAGFAVVVLAAGGVEEFTLVFTLLKQKVPILPYTIQTGGGPWHRYLVDSLLVSPIITLLAAANILQVGARPSSAHRYLQAFSCLTYAVLTVFPDGMNLRYILMLDMPLRLLATQQLFAWSKYFKRYGTILLGCAVLALCAYDLRQHRILFVKGQLYELVTAGLVHAEGIIK